MKKTTAKRARGSSSSLFDAKRFVYAEAEARFHDSVKRREGLKERGFELDSPHFHIFGAVIKKQCWQEFCKPPKVATMTIIREFYANVKESMSSVVMVREKQIRFDVIVINTLLRIQVQAPYPDDVMRMDSTTNLDEVTRVICGRVMNWIVVRGKWTAFPTKELETTMKIWHHFICARLVPTAHMTEVTQE